MLILKAAAALWHIQPKRLLCSPAFILSFPTFIPVFPDNPSPLGGKMLGKSAWCQGKAGLAKSPGSERTSASGWEGLHPGLARAGTRERYGVGLGTYGPLDVVSSMEGREGEQESKPRCVLHLPSAEGRLGVPMGVLEFVEQTQNNPNRRDTVPCFNAWGKR